MAPAVEAQVTYGIRPDLDPPGSEPVSDGESASLSADEERRLIKQLLWQPEPEWTSAQSERAMEKLLGRGRMRRLDEARFQLHLDANDWDLRSLEEDDYTFERTKDAVLSSYVKLQREMLEDAFQVEERFDAWTERLFHGDERRSAREDGPRGRSYRLRISPRASVGSSDYLGLKFRMPYADSTFLDHFSFRVRQYFDEDRTAFILKYDDDHRFIHLEYEPDTEEWGDQIALSVRLWF